MYFQLEKTSNWYFLLNEIVIFWSYPKTQNLMISRLIKQIPTKKGDHYSYLPTYTVRDKLNLTFKTFTNLILSSKRHHHEILPHRSAQIPCYLTNLNATFLRQICLLISPTNLLCFVGLSSKVTVILMRKTENM